MDSTVPGASLDVKRKPHSRACAQAPLPQYLAHTCGFVRGAPYRTRGRPIRGDVASHDHLLSSPLTGIRLSGRNQES
jgi:hypothetical protein